MEHATWVIAATSALNLTVLAFYAYFSWGIWKETQRSALRTEELARHSRKTFLLQALVALQEEIRSAMEIANRPGLGSGRAWRGVGLLQRALRATFPEEWPELKGLLHEAATSWESQTGQPID